MLATLCRHAQSQANAGQPTSDPLAVQLTDEGRRQAAALAAAWAAAPDLIVVSPALRALNTARPTASRFASTPVEEWPIQEFTYLDPDRCVSTTVQVRKPWVLDYWARSDPNWRDGARAESFADFIDRVENCIEELRRRCDNGIAHALVVGHGQFINAVRWRLAEGRNRLDMASYRAFDLANPLDNCETVSVTLEQAPAHLAPRHPRPL